MKRTSLILGLFVFLTFCVVLPGYAANKWFDNNGTTAGSGITSPALIAWSTSVAKWASESTGTTASLVWAEGDAAIFCAGSDATGTYTASCATAHNVASITVNNGTVYMGSAAVTCQTITVNSGAGLYTYSSGAIVSSAGGTLTLNGSTFGYTAGGAGGTFLSPNMNIVLNGGGTLSDAVGNPNIYSGVISGTGPLTKTGAGILSITSTETYSGSTTINNGTLRLRTSAAAQLPSGTDLTITSPGAFDPATFGQTVNSLAGSGNVAFSGASTLTVAGTPSTTFSGAITGAGSLTLNKSGGTGTLTLTGANTYTGSTTITAGTLTIGGAGALAAAGAITDNGAFIYNSTASQTLSGVISGAGTLTHAGTGTLTLSGVNTYSGITTIQNGSLVISSDGNLGTPPSSPVANQLTLNNNINNGANNYGLRDTGGNFTLNFNRGITLGANGGSINIQNGFTLCVAGVITGSGSFWASPNSSAGYGTIVVSNANNNYTGSTYIGAGTLQLGVNGALPSGTPLIIGSSSSGAGGGSFFNMNGKSQTIGPLASSTGFGATGSGTPTVTLTGALTINETSSTAFAGAITGSGGSLTLSSSSTGTLTLTGAGNTYTGPTTITAGTLALTGSGTVGTGTITVAGAATFDVSGLSSTLTLGASQTLSGPTAAGIAAINASGTAGLTMGTSGPLSLPYFAPGTPAINVTGGALTLAAGNPVTVTVKNGGTPLPVGSYLLISQGGSGSVAGTPPSSVTINGDGKAANTTVSLQITGGQLYLNIACNAPTTANAGLPQEQCETSTATLAGNTPAAGETGTWTLVSGSGTIATPSSPTSGVTGLGYGANTFQWTIHNPSCTDNSLDSSSTVTITRDQTPTTATAGGTQNLCGTGSATTAALGGNTPTVGSGSWSKVSGPGAVAFSASTSGNSTATVNAYGTYDLRWTISNGTCTPSTADVTVNFYQNPTANAGPNQDVCSGCSATIGNTPTASGGTGPYTYSWSPSTGLDDATKANPTASPATTTTYSVTVTDGNGCTSASSSVTVTVANVAPAISGQPVNTTACSGSTAAFSVTASGSSLNYYWTENNNSGWGNAWSVTGSGSTWLGTSTDNDQFQPSCNSFSANLGDIDSPVSGNALGIWGGSSGDEVAIRTFPALTAGQTVSIDFDNGNVDTGSKVGFSLQTSGNTDVVQFYFVGGQANYKYWDTVLGEQDSGIGWGYTGTRVQFALTCANTYVLTVTPCGGSPTNLTGTYSGTIAQVKLFNGNTAGGDEDNIYFNNFIVGGYTDNADNYSGGWAGQDKGNQPIASANASTYTTPALSANAQYQAVVAGCGGAMLSSVASVTVNPLPTVSVNSETICTGSPATLTATTSASTPSYLWSPGGGTSASITVSPASTTTYTVTVTDGTTGCANSGSGTVTVNPLPTVSVNSATVCAGGSVVLSASTSASTPSYLWNDPAGSTTASITVSPASTTTYTATVTDGVTGCVNSGSGTVMVNPLPTVSVNSAVICTDGSAVLSATTSASSPSYLWSPGGATTASITVSPASTTTYTVTVTDGTTTCANSGGGTVTVNPAPTLTTDTTNQTACAGSEVMWSVATTGTGLSYQWQRDGTNLLEGVDNFTGTAAATLTNSAVASTDGVDAAHGYACVVSIGTCSVTSTLVSLTVNPLPTVSVNSATVCAGGSAMLTATTSASSPSYLWNDPAGSTAASITVSPAATTSYTVTVTDGTTGCAASGSGTVTVNPLPTVSVNSAIVCAGDSAILTATATASSPSYLWNDPASSTTASITVSPATTTTYMAIVTDGVTGCVNTGSGTVTVNPLPTVSVNSAAVCAGGSATLTATTSASSPSYLWSPGGATTASITVSPASTTTYTVTVTDGTTGCNNGGSGTVTVNAAPTADAGSAQTVCAGTPGGTAIGGSPTATGGTAPYTYSWTPTTGLDDATAANPTAEIGSTATYTVTVTDHNGCTATASVVLTVPPLPNIESTVMSGTDVTLVWDSLAGQTYRVQYTTDLPDPPTPAIWTDLTPDVTAAGATATYTDHAGAATQRFYRIFIVCP